MYTAPFEYHTPGSVEEAIALLQQYEDEAKLIAGGHSLIPVMKLRFAQPAHLIDIRRIPGLAGIREDGDALVVGALTTYRQLADSELLRRRVPILAETAREVGDMQVRNLGTIGGSLAHADPAADMPATVLALDATIRAVGPNGSRTVAVDDFFVAMMTSALEPDEVLTEIRVPLPPERTGGAYEKYAHPASGYALCGVAAVVTLGGQGRVERARVALTGVGLKATRATATEQALAGQEPSAETIERAAQRVTDGMEIRTDNPGSEGYNAHIAQLYTKRAIERAVARARGA